MAVSADSVFSNREFAKQTGANDYPVLADWHPHGKWAREFGLWVEEKGCPSRSTIIVDKDGKIVDVHTNPIGDDRDFSQTLQRLDQINQKATV